MTVFYHQRLNRTRATSPWSDELLMIEFAGVSGTGQLLPTASGGLFNFCFCSSHAEAPNTQTMARDCDLIRSDARGRKRFKHTLASRPFLARRFQHNQGALPPVEFDRVCASRRKQSP